MSRSRADILLLRDFRMTLMRWLSRSGGICLASLSLSSALAQAPLPLGSSPSKAEVKAAAQRPLAEWLARMKRAAIEQRYIGTYVVSSPNGAMSSSRIWHAGDGRQQVERIESLTGSARLTYRHDNEVLTLIPDQKLGYTEKPIPSVSTADKPTPPAAPAWHTVSLAGSERVAGVDTWVLQVSAKDKHRYSYRIWSERRTGLVVKSDTLDARQQVVEQSGFSDLQLPAKVDLDDLLTQMKRIDGYRLQVVQWASSPAAQRAWEWVDGPPGFAVIDCSERQGSTPTAQCRLSDGMATVSIFIENFEPNRHVTPLLKSVGATHAISDRLTSKDGKSGDWWLTAMGEVPLETLKALLASTRRR